MCEHGAGDLLLAVVPQNGSCGWPTRSCTLLDALDAQTVHQLGLLPGCCGEDVLGEFSR
jgi:hypothetical protein